MWEVIDRGSSAVASTHNAGLKALPINKVTMSSFAIIPTLFMVWSLVSATDPTSRKRHYSVIRIDVEVGLFVASVWNRIMLICYYACSLMYFERLHFFNY